MAGDGLSVGGLVELQVLRVVGLGRGLLGVVLVGHEGLLEVLRDYLGDADEVIGFVYGANGRSQRYCKFAIEEEIYAACLTLPDACLALRHFFRRRRGQIRKNLLFLLADMGQFNFTS